MQETVKYTPEETAAAQAILRENGVVIDICDDRNYAEIARGLGYIVRIGAKTPPSETLEV